MTESTATRRERLREELRNYAIISAYLFVCFGIILLYESSVLQARGADPLNWTLALVKALVMGKFILIGHAISIGARADEHPLLHRIVWKSVAMLALLALFKCAEELLVGWFHDRAASEVLHEFLALSWIQMVAPVLLMLLILIPLVSASEIYWAVGGDRFRNTILGANADQASNRSDL